ncbi:MAG: SDR family oxidoreductase [Candidatus Nitrotoga sp.]
MKTVLITGANRGIGLEFARQYAADGWTVLACCRTPGQSDALNKLARQFPDLVKIYGLDIADHEQIEELTRVLSSQSAVINGIDLLINNAGIYPDSYQGSFGHTDYEMWMKSLRVNTMAPLKMAEAFVTRVERSQLKTIVTIGTKMGSIADNSSGGSYLYRTSKAAVNMVVKNLSIDLKPRGIIAVVLHPGWVKTDLGGANALISAEQSVSGMRKVISRLSPADSGKFLTYDGKDIPW